MNDIMTKLIVSEMKEFISMANKHASEDMPEEKIVLAVAVTLMCFLAKDMTEEDRYGFFNDVPDMLIATFEGKDDY